jgi:hypothetical protein
MFVRAIFKPFSKKYCKYFSLLKMSLNKNHKTVVCFCLLFH